MKKKEDKSANHLKVEIINPLKVPPNLRKKTRRVSTGESDSKYEESKLPQPGTSNVPDLCVDILQTKDYSAERELDNMEMDPLPMTLDEPKAAEYQEPENSGKDGAVSAETSTTEPVAVASVVGEIDSILAMIKQTGDTGAAPDLSSRLVDLAMKLKSSKEQTPQVAKGSNPTAGSELKARDGKAEVPSNVNEKKDASSLPGEEVVIDTGKTALVPDTNSTSSMHVEITPTTALGNQHDQSINAHVPSPAATSAIAPSSVTILSVDTSGDIDRCHTPVQDDTYDMNLEVSSAKAFVQNIINEEQKNLAKFPGDSLPNKAATNRLQVCKLLRTALDKPGADVELIADLVEKVYSENPPTPEVVRSLLQPSSSVQKSLDSEKPPAAEATKQQRWYYVFDPRGHEECADIDYYLERLDGTRFHPHDLTDVVKSCLPPRTHQPPSSQVSITEEMLDKAIPAGKVWIVMRTEDTKFLSILPNLPLLKCGGARVQFICADTVDNIHNKNFSTVLDGEQGILIPASCDVILNNYDHFLRLIAWASTTPVNTDENGCKWRSWRIAVYQHVKTELEAIRATMGNSAEMKLKRRIALTVLHHLNKAEQVVQYIPSSTATVTTQQQQLSPSQVCSSAIELQINQIHFTRHVVVLTDKDVSALVEWQSLPKAGIATATVDQFVHAMFVKNAGKPARFSPLMNLYRIEA